MSTSINLLLLFSDASTGPIPPPGEDSWVESSTMEQMVESSSGDNYVFQV